ncbi:PAS domain S-box protein [Noviherbaspirillum sp.]|uniref:PAS domain S-box protein n=1 Tax=Noviherbaspirillum sp. TaxID=1926288 RepID=UPI002B48EE05|nr:PAS domain S-box protein [Noviherbaspirillum sp.]HJV82885.1 PAS domain S-box protein [Noviherbaspirillum sp.]
MSFDMPISKIIRSEILQCPPHTPINEAIRSMHQSRCGSILITERGEAIGIWTRCDALRIDLKDPGAIKAPIASVMSPAVKTLRSDTTVSVASHFFLHHRIRHALVIDEAGQPVGMLSQSDVAGIPSLELDVKLKTVGSLIERPALILPGDLALADAARKMAMHSRDAIVVESGKDVGILTELDVIGALDSRQTELPVGQLATYPLISVEADTSLFFARALCAEKGIRHLGVTDGNGAILGILSQTEVLAGYERDYLNSLQHALSDHKQRLAKADQELLLARQVFDATGEGIMITSPDGVIRTVNPAFSRITGYSRDEALGKTPRLLRSGRHSEAFYTDMWNAIRSTGRWEGEIWDRRKSGEDFPKWLSIRALTDETGAVSSYIGTFSDITDKKQAQEALRESEERLRTLIDATPDYICFKDGDGRWQEVNKSTVDLFGLHDLPYQGRTDQELAGMVEPTLAGALAQSAEDDARAWASRHMLRTSQTIVSPSGDRTYDIIRTPVFHPDGSRKAIATLGRDLSDLHRAEQERQESERRMHDIMATLGDGVMVMDPDGKLVYLNPAGEALLGWKTEEVAGRKTHEQFHFKRPDGSLLTAQECPTMQALRAGALHRAKEDYFVRKDGSLLPVSLVATPLLKNGKVDGSVVSFHDISGSLEAERAIREREERYRALFNASSDAIFVCLLTPEGLTSIVEVNDVACWRLGYTREELLSLTASTVDATGSLGDFPLIAERLLNKGEAMFVTEHRTKNGKTIPVEISVRSFEWKDTQYALCIARDITERQAQEEELRRRAHSDSLTQLPNRSFLLELTKRTLAAAIRNKNQFALLFLDLDGFKQINDTLGHEVGDLVLKAAGERMVKAVRGCDIVSRLGGDEFVIVLTEITNAEDATAVAGKVEEAVSQPLRIGDHALDIRTSVGVAVYPRDGEDIPALMRFADRAMYDCKAAHRKRRLEKPC